MSKEFVQGKYGSRELTIARRQQEQLSYFTQSQVQPEITQSYISTWAQRNYATNDYFLSWIKNIFRTENFITMYKYLRFPLPSAKLVNDDIVPQLNRVFTAEDAYRLYKINGTPIETPEELQFNEFQRELFNQFLFGFNNVIFTDLSDINKPKREFIDIKHVVAIDVCGDRIERIAVRAEMKNPAANTPPSPLRPNPNVPRPDLSAKQDDEIYGYLYADDKEYIFYDKDYNPIKTTPHDLGECPADFVSQEQFIATEKNCVVRKSIFSYVREELEEYTFLKTLLKMSEPNGAIPVVTMLQTNIVNNKAGKQKKGVSTQEPMTAFEIGGAHSQVGSDVAPSDGQLQTGTVIKIAPQKDDSGKIDMTLVTDYFKFHYIPIECLKYINERLEFIKSNIISSVVGHYKDDVKVAKNEKQVNTGLIEKQDNLKRIADNLSKVITKTDFKFLALEYGREAVSVDVFLGTDFFLESADELYDLFAKSPNPLESKRILDRLSQNRNRNNPTMAKRERILYKLLPYANDKDFGIALEQMIVDDVTKQLQLRFTYWIDLFESEYGDLVEFWNSSKMNEKEKTIFIYNLIKDKINEQAISNPATVVPGQ